MTKQIATSVAQHCFSEGLEDVSDIYYAHLAQSGDKMPNVTFKLQSFIKSSFNKSQ